MEWKDKYRVISVLKDRGGTKVCIAEHIRLKQLRIMKTIYGASEHTSAVLREAVLMRQLKHPCIPVVYDIEEQDNGVTVIEEYIRGESLSSYFQLYHPEKEKITAYLCQLLDLLEYLHRQKPAILHLDLKPDNLLIYEEHIYLVDFGSAIQENQVREHSMLTGTPGFAAPECYHGEATVKSDIFSAGKLLEYMLQHSNTAVKKSSRLQRQLYRIAKKAVRPKPAERYASAEEMKQAVRRLMERQNKLQGCCTIALSGAVRRIGVTWLAFQLGIFLKRRGIHVVYLECNDTGAVKQLKSEQSDWNGNDLPRYKGIPYMETEVENTGRESINPHLAAEEEQKLEEQGFQVILKDFGVLTPEKKACFLQADLSLLVAGINDWELENTWKSIQKLCRNEEKFCLLLNLTGKRAYASFARKIRWLPCYRVPFAAGEETPKERQELTELFSELYERLQSAAEIRRKRIRGRKKL